MGMGQEAFSDPEGMIMFLLENRIHLCLWIYPYIGEESEYFRLAGENGWLVKDGNGNPLTSMQPRRQIASRML